MSKSSNYQSNRDGRSMTTTLPSNPRRHKQGLSKAQRQNLESHRYRRNPQPSKHKLKTNKSVIQKHKECTKQQPEDPSYYSDSYATMRGLDIDKKSRILMKFNAEESVEDVSKHVGEETDVQKDKNQVPLRRHSIDLIGDNVKPQLTVEETTLNPKLKSEEVDKNKLDNQNKNSLTPDSDNTKIDDDEKKFQRRNTKTGYTAVLPKKFRPSTIDGLGSNKTKTCDEEDKNEKINSPYSVTTPILSPHFSPSIRTGDSFNFKPEEKPYDVLVRDDVKAKWPIKEEPEKSTTVTSPKLYLE